MSYRTCEDCGSRMYDGFCTNCDEEHFIADQYRELGESVPQGIADSEREQIERKQASHVARCKWCGGWQCFMCSPRPINYEELALKITGLFVPPDKVLENAGEVLEMLQGHK